MPPKTKRAGEKVTETDKARKTAEFPADIDDKDKWEKVTYDKLAVGDYIMYKTKPRTFRGKEHPVKINQGYVSLLQNEVGDAKWKDQEGKVLGMKNYNVSWSNNTKDIDEMYRSLTTKTVRSKGLEKSTESLPERQEEKRVIAKAKEEMKQKDKEESKKLEQDPDALQKLAKEIERELNPPAKRQRKSRAKPQFAESS